jgi:chemotaxis protein MotA
MIVGNSTATLKRVFADVLGLLKPNPYDKKAFGELLHVLFEIFQTARRDGLVGLEPHIENPGSSTIFRRFPGVRTLVHGHALQLLCDTLKVQLSGTIDDHHLAEILDLDLERHHEEAMVSPSALAKVSDAMPGFGIVAAVLGVVITMQSITGSASEIGEKVAAALVGTFLGILLSYGVLSPIAQAVETRIRGEAAYLGCIRTALLSFARGDAPMTCVEFARRNVEPQTRPSFSELETIARRRAA